MLFYVIKDFCSKRLETIQTIKINNIFWRTPPSNADRYYCNIIASSLGLLKVEIIKGITCFHDLGDVLKVKQDTYIFFSPPKIKGNCYIIILKFFPINFLHISCKIYSFPVIFIHKSYNFCYSSWIFFYFLII